MAWFSSHGSRESGASKAPPGAADMHRSLGLAALLEGLAGAGKVQVLDLGSAVGSNVDYLARFGCKLYIEDLYAAISARGAVTPGGTRLSPTFFAESLSFAPDTRFD